MPDPGYFGGAQTIGPRRSRIEQATQDISDLWNYHRTFRPGAATDPAPTRTADMQPAPPPGAPRPVAAGATRVAQAEPAAAPKDPTTKTSPGLSAPARASRDDRAISRAAEKIAPFGGAYEPSPDWSGGQPLTMGEMERNYRGHEAINARHEQALRAIDLDEAARGDAMENQIRARQKTLAYESLLPAFSGVDAQGRPIPNEPRMQVRDETRGMVSGERPTTGGVGSAGGGITPQVQAQIDAIISSPMSAGSKRVRINKLLAGSQPQPGDQRAIDYAQEFAPSSPTRGEVTSTQRAAAVEAAKGGGTPQALQSIAAQAMAQLAEIDNLPINDAAKEARRQQVIKRAAQIADMIKTGQSGAGYYKTDVFGQASDQPNPNPSPNAQQHE